MKEGRKGKAGKEGERGKGTYIHTCMHASMHTYIDRNRHRYILRATFEVEGERSREMAATTLSHSVF